MRRSVFLAVLLSLVLGLLKGDSSEPNSPAPENPTTTSPGDSSEPSSPAPENPTTTSPGDSSEPSSPAPENPTTTSPGDSSEPSSPATKNPTTTSSGDSSEPSSPAPENPTTTSPGDSSEPSSPAPENPTTTSPGDSSEPSSPAPENPTTTSPGDSSEPSSPAPENPTTTSPGDSSEPSSPAPENPTTTSPETSCESKPCGVKQAKCVDLFSNFTCVCDYGFYYNNEDCHRGVIFPGAITLKGSYSDSVQNVNSMQYEEVFQNITKFFKDSFTAYRDFKQTVIVKIQPQKSRTSLMDIIVTNMFTENSTISNKSVTDAITKAIQKHPEVYGYREESYCAAFDCDDQTTICKNSEFPQCDCKEGFSKTKWDVRSCSDCKGCSAEENKYCAKEMGIPTCKCMSNFEMKNNECVTCPVGYSGENCKNNRELILIIVGTVFGAIILSLGIALTIVSVRAKHKQDPEKKSLIKSGYSKTNDSDERQNTIFPRVRTISGHANPGYQPNNPYEMRSTNRGRYQEQDYIDSYEIPQEPESFSMQSRY